MLVTLKDILRMAQARNCAIGSFNTPNLESIQAVLGAAEELNVPVIIMHAQCHEEIIPLDVIGPIMVSMAEKAAVPVCVHLDHGETLPYLQRALELGFTSIMYDGSALPYLENVANTCAAVAMARKMGASVEAEIGTLGKREMGAGHGDDTPAPIEIYTDPVDAKRFVEETGIDALACAFGTAHGLYLKAPKLDFSVLDGVREVLDLPLVMHGGSGVSDEDYRTAISKGIRKVNYYTYMAKAGGEGVCRKVSQALADGSVVYYHEVTGWAREAMAENVKRAMQVFSCGAR